MHLIAKEPSDWTEYHESFGHHFLSHSPHGSLLLHVSSLKHILLDTLCQLSESDNVRLCSPIANNIDRSVDLRIEGAIEAICKLDDFSERLVDYSILTHEGFSDKTADGCTGTNSRPMLEDGRRLYPKLECHIKGLGFFEKIMKKCGHNANSCHAAAGIALSTDEVNPLDPDFDMRKHFALETNRPDSRLEMLAEHSSNLTDPPPDSKKDCEEFFQLGEKLFPSLKEKIVKDVRQPDIFQRIGPRRVMINLAAMTSSVPYLGVDTKFVNHATARINEDAVISDGRPEQIQHIIRSLPIQQVRSALKSAQNLIGVDVDSILQNPSILSRVAQDLSTNYALRFAILSFHPPAIIHDDGSDSVSGRRRIDVSQEDLTRLLFRDLLESITKILMGKTSVDDGNQLVIPCYLGLARGPSCSKTCLARHLLKFFLFEKKIVLMCRPRNKEIKIIQKKNTVG